MYSFSPFDQVSCFVCFILDIFPVNCVFPFLSVDLFLIKMRDPKGYLLKFLNLVPIPYFVNDSKSDDITNVSMEISLIRICFLFSI